MKIFALTQADAPHIAHLHAQALAGDFLPSLGKRFLTLCYANVLTKPDIYGSIAKDHDVPVGFVLGTKSMRHFMKLALSSRKVQMATLLLGQILRRPRITKKVLETLFYTKKEVGPEAELVVVAVDEKLRGRGVGRKLVEKLEKDFMRQGVNHYKLTVHADKPAVLFYERLGFVRLATFWMYGKMWYVYEKRIV